MVTAMQHSPDPDVAQLLNGPLDEPGFTFTPTGLKIESWVTFEQWDLYGRKLQLADKGIQWALGDWVIWGEGKFKERASQAVAFSGLKVRTLQNYAVVAEAFKDKSRRRDSDEVDFSTHAAVASLPEPEQDRIIEMAAENPEVMTREKVRIEVSRTRRRLGREKTEIQLLQTSEVQSWLSNLHKALSPFEASVPNEAGFLKVMIRSFLGVVEEQSERTIESDCDKIMSMFEGDKEAAPYSATETEIYRWLIAHFYFIKTPEVNERLEQLCNEKRLKHVQTGGRKEGQRGDMVWVYMPYGSRVFD